MRSGEGCDVLSKFLEGDYKHIHLLERRRKPLGWTVAGKDVEESQERSEMDILAQRKVQGIEETNLSTNGNPSPSTCVIAT